MNIVFIVPTGLGAEIGGHSGDANPVIKLFAGICDTVITHPNVVNASDINEMPSNTLYVEGSILDRFLWGNINLCPVSYNRILLAVNKPADIDVINAASAARVTLGADIRIIELDTPLKMTAKMENGQAGGDVRGYRQLINQVRNYEFDALAISTPITVSKQVAFDYLRNGGVNPWGGVEAIASKMIANGLDKPVAHAPCGEGAMKGFKEVVDPRLSAETVSVCYLHCVLKGLHKAPRIGIAGQKGINVSDVDCLITPWGCEDEPHWACMEKGIPIITVRENQTVLEYRDGVPEDFIVAENYLEAAGIIASMKSGIYYKSVRRPIEYTKIYRTRPSGGINNV